MESSRIFALWKFGVAPTLGLWTVSKVRKRGKKIKRPKVKRSAGRLPLEEVEEEEEKEAPGLDGKIIPIDSC